MKKVEQLPAELIWQEDGHLSDVVLTALADGQASIVPADATRHLGPCESCAKRLGAAALLSTDTSLALAALAREKVASPAKAALVRRTARVPFAAIAAALVVAVVGMLPLVTDVSTLWSDARFIVSRGAPTVMRSLPLALRAASAGFERYAALLTSLSALVLVGLALSIVRLMPRPSLAPASGAGGSDQGVSL